MTTRVMIVEDEGLFRDLLRTSLAIDPAIEVVGAAADGESSISMAQELSPDVIIMDIDLGKGPDGIEAGIRIKERAPHVGIVLLSAHKDKEYLRAIPAHQLGGWSYLLKHSLADLRALTRALQGTAAGLMILDAELVRELRPKPNSRLGSLGDSWREVLALIAQGYSNADIAQKLLVGEEVIEDYIDGIYQHLQIIRGDPVHPRVRAVLRLLEDSR